MQTRYPTWGTYSDHGSKTRTFLKPVQTCPAYPELHFLANLQVAVLHLYRMSIYARISVRRVDIVRKVDGMLLMNESFAAVQYRVRYYTKEFSKTSIPLV